MSKIRPLQRSFSSGEISPRFLSRPDLPFYAQALKSLINWVITPQGTVAKRNGSEMISEISDTLLYGRIFSFRVQGSNSFIVALTTESLSLYDLGGPVTGSNEFVNPSFDENLDGWNKDLQKTGIAPLSSEPRIDWNFGAAKISSGNAAETFESQITDGNREGEDLPITVIIHPSSARFSQQVTGMTGNDLHTLRLTIVPGTFRAQGVMLDYLSIGTTDGDNDIPYNIDPLDSAVVTFTPGAASFWISYKLSWDDSLDVTVQSTGPYTGNIGASARVEFDSIVLENFNTTSGQITFSSPYTEDEIKEIQVEVAPGLDTMYFVVRSATPTHKLEFIAISGIFSFLPVTFTSPPATWAADGYPGAITFHRGRMELAGTRVKPVTTWLSVAGEDNFENFDVGTGLDDEALELPLARDSRIQWTQGGKALILGTDISEHTLIGETDQSPITPSSADAPQQSNYGSARIHGKWLSDRVVYVSNDNRRIYAMQYSRNARQYLSEELTYKSEHITKGLIRELEVGQNPRQHIWNVLEDGNLVGCTFQPEGETLGWYRYETRSGDIKSSAVMTRNGLSILWILVLRKGVLYLERQGPEPLDSYLIRDYADEVTVIDGLDHLENTLVQVKSGLSPTGSFAGNYVVTNGQVIVNDQFKNRSFAVGEVIESTMVTLPVDLINQTDTLASKLLRWSKIYVRLAGLRPNVNGIVAPDRTATSPMDSPELNTENLDITGSLGRDRAGSITLTQNLPLDTEIYGLFGELQQDGL